MPISKIGSKALVDCSVAAVDIADNSITAAKLAGSIANAKLANSSVTINNTSVSLGASANIAALDWQSVITADGSTSTTGVAGRGYFINTTSAAHTFTLPTSATRGDTIAIKDYAGTFGTNKLTIARNGHNIQGVANNSLIGTNRASVVLVYVDVTRGWEFVTESNVADLQEITFISATGGTITTSGNFKIHTFTGDGSFVVATLGNPVAGPAGSNVDYLVVAGGGGGGGNQNSWGSGGGGAGGYRTTFPSPGCNAGAFPVTATTYPITVGGGGAGGSSTPSCIGAPQSQGSAGSNSVFSTITSTGGGSANNSGNGTSGGSGGGATAPYNGGGPVGTATGGSGNTPPTSPPQGNPGGTALGHGDNTSPVYQRAGGGGGGGAGGAGSASPGSPSGGPWPGGAGGPGSTNSISGSPVTYAGGGGGGVSDTPPANTAGAGGTGGGGGGYAGPTPGGTAPSGTTNTGGGGGGGGRSSAGGAGGKGIVIIRYKFQ